MQSALALSCNISVTCEQMLSQGPKAFNNGTSKNRSSNMRTPERLKGQGPTNRELRPTYQCSLKSLKQSNLIPNAARPFTHDSTRLPPDTDRRTEQTMPTATDHGGGISTCTGHALHLHVKKAWCRVLVVHAESKERLRCTIAASGRAASFLKASGVCGLLGSLAQVCEALLPILQLAYAPVPESKIAEAAEPTPPRLATCAGQDALMP